ncbi:ATP-binding protein [Geothrix sp. 21YS21S-2]|uniref:ATP-binding protein n=1 Tax=Geothrix sp. 21YS21S-2 TaxID=3068893 RepID=UPI0027BAD31F|nr:ATP-binding protein [Geothrix sp. 21YS21S-2]
MTLIPSSETLTVEFKSDRKGLPDHELVEALVGMANAEGGEVFLGVEDDGSPTGLHANHLGLGGLPGMVASLTRPPLAVQTELIEQGPVKVARITVSKAMRIVATAGGLVVRRQLRSDGKPENAPMYPGDYLTRQGDLGILDFSALPVETASADDLDPLERVRLRNMIELFRGDAALLNLDDQALDEALNLTVAQGGRQVPTVAGLLILGRERALKAHLSTHEAAFQVLDGTDVRVNAFMRWPLLKTFQYLDEQFALRYEEQELNSGLFRVPVPNFDRRGFREALVNALIHRDFTRLGTVHFVWENDGITISNPGGFPAGVNPDNILTVRPTPRNPCLADAIKRIGIAERTGRGVDLIFEGLLRFGRPAPDYSATGATAVVVKLFGGKADLAFLENVLTEEKRLGALLPLEALIVLATLKRDRRRGTADLARAMQRAEASARPVLERLVENGLVEAHGTTHRIYTLSSRLYRNSGQSAAYVRQSGIEPIRHEEMVLKLVETQGILRRADVMELCGLSPNQARKLLARLVESGRLQRDGKTRGATYQLAGPR